MNENSISENQELKELIGNIHRASRTKLFIFGISLIVGLSLKGGGIRFPLTVLEIIVLFFLMNAIYELFAKKIWFKQTVEQVSGGYLLFQILEVVALLILIYFLGAVLFLGTVILIVYMVLSYLVFSRKIYPWVIAFFATSGYIALGLLEYFAILPYIDLYNLGINPTQNLPLFIATLYLTVSLLIALLFYLEVLFRARRDLVGKLKIEIEQLKEMSREKEALEKKFGAQSEKVKDLSEKLEEQLKLREREFHRLKELEKFHKLAVDRELKMIELKEEIKKLKERLKPKEYDKRKKE